MQTRYTDTGHSIPLGKQDEDAVLFFNYQAGLICVRPRKRLIINSGERNPLTGSLLRALSKDHLLRLIWHFPTTPYPASNIASKCASAYQDEILLNSIPFLN